MPLVSSCNVQNRGSSCPSQKPSWSPNWISITLIRRTWLYYDLCGSYLPATLAKIHDWKVDIYIQRKIFFESLSKKTETCTRTYNFGTLSLATVAQMIVSNVKWCHELLALDIHNTIEEKLKQSDQNWLSRHGCDTSYEVPQIGFGGPVLATISGTFARVKPLRGLEALPI